MKRFLKIGAAIVVVLIAVAIAIPFLIDANQFRPLLESKIGEAVGRTVKLGNLKLSLWNGQLGADEIEIGEDPAFGSEPFVKAQKLDVGVEMRPLIFDRQLRITGITIERPEVRLVLSQDGKWNVSGLGAKPGAAPAAPSSSAAGGSTPEFQIQQVKITDGKFTLVRAGDPKPQVFEDIDLTLDHVALHSAVAFQLTAKRSEGGSVTIAGTAGPLSGGDGLPPVNAKFDIPSLDLTKSGLVDPSAGVGATVSLNGTVETKQNNVAITGTLRAEKLKLVNKGSPAQRPVTLTFAANHNVVRRSGKLDRADIAIGSAKSTITGTYTLAGKAPSFALKYRGDKMPLTELAAMLPALDVQLPGGSKIEAGTLSMSADVAGTLAQFTAMGPIDVDGAKLSGFDLGSKMRTIQMLAGLPATPVTEIQKLSARVRRTPDGTVIDGITMAVPTIGTLDGAGTVDAENRLDFKMRATLHTSGVLMKAIGQKGDTTVPFLITGTAQNPSFKPNIGAIAGQKVQQLAKDPVKTIDAAKSIFQMFRKPKDAEPPKQ